MWNKLFFFSRVLDMAVKIYYWYNEMSCCDLRMHTQTIITSKKHILSLLVIHVALAHGSILCAESINIKWIALVVIDRFPSLNYKLLHHI